jgi:hypothetical protein
LNEAQRTVRPAPDNIRIVLILAVILPETDRADLEVPASAERLAEAARTAKRSVRIAA